ncbi:MAG: hypothetical protein ABSD44_13615 [Terracidiphilus sp.]
MLDKARGLMDEFIKENPAEWQLLYPRIYKDVGRYHSAKDVSVDLSFALFYALRQAGLDTERLPSNDKLALIAASDIVAKKVPVYYVAPQLIEAIVQTQPPEPLDWQNMHLPFESAAFVFPKGTLVHPTGGECGHLWYSRMRAGTSYWHPFFPKMGFQVPENRLFFRTILSNSLECLSQNVTATSSPLLHLNDLSAPDIIENLNPVAGILDATDKKILESAISLSMGVLLAMLTRPDLLSGGESSGKRTKSGSELWTPNIIGNSYRAAVHSGPQGESGISPRMHWRRGHFRSQPYGSGQLLRKIIWIEPILVAAGK